MRHGPMLAFVKDAQGRYVFANPTMERTFGFRVADLQDRTDVDWLGPVPEAAQRHGAALEADAPVETVETVAIADGSTRHFMVIRFPFAERDGRQLVGGVAVDVTSL